MRQTPVNVGVQLLAGRGRRDQSLDVDVPAEALEAGTLKEIRLELANIPSPFQEETVNVTMSIGAGK